MKQQMKKNRRFTARAAQVTYVRTVEDEKKKKKDQNVEENKENQVVKFKIKIKQKTVTRRLSEHRIENRR
jgi:hypothetical protein